MASETYKQLRQILTEKGELKPEDVENITKEHGPLSNAEHIDLEALKLKHAKQGRAEISMDDYLKATQILDSAAEGSEEYKAALTIVEAFEGGG